MVSTEARFAPGDWYAVVGDAATVVLPVGHRDRVAALWDLADAGADADTLLDALLAGGLASLDHFALVAHDDEATRVIVRGAPTAAVSAASGDEVVSAAPGTTWSEKVVTGVTSVRVALAGDAETAHALTPGLARVSVVEFGRPTAAAPGGSAGVAPAVAAPAEAAPADAAPAEDAPAAEPVAPVMAAEPEPVVEPVADPEPEPLPEPVAEQEPVEEPEAVAEPEPAAEAEADPWDEEPVLPPGPLPAEVETPWDAPPESEAVEADVTDEADTDARLELPAPPAQRAALRRGRR